MTLYKNAKIVMEDRIREGCVLTDETKILDIAERFDESDAAVIDCKGNFLAPGFADIHVHGGGGYSAMAETPEEIIKMCTAHAERGTTSIVPTTLAAPVAQLKTVMDTLRSAAAQCGLIRGIHLEGPFISMKMRGAQSPENILLPTEKNVDDLLEDSRQVVMMGSAPEIEGCFALAEKLQNMGIIASAAHTDCSYETAEEALRHGYSDVTHLYSACSAMHKEGIFRQVGIVEAALANDGYSTQFIADLRHLPCGALKLIYKAKGADKAYCITDGLEYSALDMQDGTCIMQKNGLEVLYEDNVMKLADRSCLAGSTATSSVLVKNLWKKCGIALPDVIRMASSTPLHIIGQDKTKGYIRKGYDADIVLFDENVQIQYVRAGKKVYRAF